MIGEPVIASVTGRQLGFLPNVIQPPLLGVVIISLGTRFGGRLATLTGHSLGSASPAAHAPLLTLRGCRPECTTEEAEKAPH